MTFSELGIPPSLIAALAKQGITEPMPVQNEAIPTLLTKKDAYVTSETGSGKTLAYLLPLLCSIDPLVEATQALVVVPTHELALQIHRLTTLLTQTAQLPIRAILLLGGTSIDRQIEKLKKKPHIAVGSPGRILELVEKGKLKLKNIQTVVIDEADELLTGNSLKTVLGIIHATPTNRQLILVSATVLVPTEHPESAKEIAKLSPDLLTVRAALAPINPKIGHHYFIGEERKKPDNLRKLLHASQAERALVFVHRNEAAYIIASKLEHHGLSTSNLQGANHKADRKKAMDDFSTGRARVLIASDIAARGLDIPDVTHVFNLDVPTQSKDYLHRVGRTGRAGAGGTAISLLTEPEVRLMRRHSAELSIDISEIELREGTIFLAPVNKEKPRSKSHE